MLNRIGAASGAALRFLQTAFSDWIEGLLDRTSFTVALFLLVVVPFAGWTAYDRIFNYVRTTVQISKVEHVCYAEKKTDKRDYEALPQSACETLRQETASGGSQNLRIRENTFLSFQYTSPVDGKVHEGRVEHKSAANPPEVNDEIQVLISRIDPGVVRD